MKLKEQINGREVDRGWVNYINTNKVNLYPIQFANCDRMWWNDCVYIFDEVGSGKTISSGLMALDYLYNNRTNNKQVLIITINALSKRTNKTEHGQFLQDWFYKLPFEELNFQRRIIIINNHCSNISKLVKSQQNFGLIIIDEAHLFSNDDTNRTWFLKQLCAEKLVFMSATPFRKCGGNLRTYSGIASSILKKSQNEDAIMKILETNKKSENELICSLFDVKCPVTRYFKDTIKSLIVNGYHKDKARRLLSSVWEYGSQDTINDNITNSPKINKLINGINEIIDSSPGIPNRFIIFVRYVVAEASAIEEAFQKAGYKQFSKFLAEDKSYAVVTG